jgi:predicted DNA-binding transcriptional regulator AlpA
MERASIQAAPDRGPEALERMTTQEVMALARISRATLWRRVAARRLPAPVDQGRQALFLKVDVLAALQGEAAGPVSVTVAAVQRLEALRRRRQKSA